MKTMKTSLVSLLVFATCGAAAAFGQSHSLEKKWESEATLKVPESVLFDAERQVLYVTNIDGAPWGRDDKGSVGKLGLDGKVIEVDWVTGLQAPKGMALHEKHLYVGDLGEVVVIDIEKGEIAARIAVEGAKGLNDVSIDKQGVVFVTDSEGKKLYRIENGEPTVMLENLKGPNGVLAHNGAVYIVDGEALYRVMEDRS
ncbi:MAG TPA: ATP/GTP-binding protein, partial [Opitutus sp.]|nr:ATP/GTP-binding protein [Opitutus sp.]